MALNKTQRWITILDILFSKGRGLTTNEIVEELNRRQGAGKDTQLRDVQRDLKEMADWDVAPVTQEDESPPRWKLDNAKLSLFTKRFALTPEAATTVTVAIEHLEKLLPPVAFESLLESKQEAQRVLQRFTQEGRRPWIDKLRVVSTDHHAKRLKIDRDIRTALYDALIQDRQIRLRYAESGTDQVNEALYHPIGLVVGTSRLQLVVHQGGVLLVLEGHRIKSAELLSLRAAPLAGFDLDRFIESHDPNLAWSERLPAGHGDERFVALVYARLKDYWEVSPLDETQTITPAGDRWRIEARAVASIVNPVFERFLLSHGADVTVLSPSGLRRKLKGHATTMLAQYDEALADDGG